MTCIRCTNKKSDMYKGILLCHNCFQAEILIRGRKPSDNFECLVCWTSKVPKGTNFCYEKCIDIARKSLMPYSYGE